MLTYSFFKHVKVHKLFLKFATSMYCSHYISKTKAFSYDVKFFPSPSLPPSPSSCGCIRRGQTVCQASRSSTPLSTRLPRSKRPLSPPARTSLLQWRMVGPSHYWTIHIHTGQPNIVPRNHNVSLLQVQ